MSTCRAFSLAAACLVVLAGCSKEEKRARQASSPKQAVMNYTRAVQTGDKDLFLAAVAVDDREFAESVFESLRRVHEFVEAFDKEYGDELLKKMRQERAELALQEVDAEAEITQKGDRGTAKMPGGLTLKLVRIDGTWKVDLREDSPAGAERERVLADAREKARGFEELRREIGRPESDGAKIIARAIRIMGRRTSIFDDPRVTGGRLPAAGSETDRPHDAGTQTPPSPPAAPAPLRVVWPVAGWQSAALPAAHPMREACDVLKRIGGRTAKAVVGVAFGPKVSGKDDAAYRRFRQRQFQLLDKALAAERMGGRGIVAPRPDAVRGVDYDRAYRQKVAKLMEVAVAVQDGRCAAYWFWGHVDARGRFRRALGTARVLAPGA